MFDLYVYTHVCVLGTCAQHFPSSWSSTPWMSLRITPNGCSTFGLLLFTPNSFQHFRGSSSYPKQFQHFGASSSYFKQLPGFLFCVGPRAHRRGEMRGHRAQSQRVSPLFLNTDCSQKFISLLHGTLCHLFTKTEAKCVRYPSNVQFCRDILARPMSNECSLKHCTSM